MQSAESFGHERPRQEKRKNEPKSEQPLKTFGFVEQSAEKKDELFERQLQPIERAPTVDVSELMERLMKVTGKDKGRLRDTESSINNTLLRESLARQRRGGEPLRETELKEKVGRFIGSPKFPGIDNIEMNDRIGRIWRGLEGMKKAIQRLKTDFELIADSYDKRQFIGLNDHIDAKHKIDAVQIFQDAKDETDIELVRLVQVKSSSSNESARAVAMAHQEYVDQLASAAEAELSESEKRMLEARRDFEKILGGKDMGEKASETLGRYHHFFLEAATSHADKFDEKKIASWAEASNLSRLEVVQLLQSGRPDDQAKNAAAQLGLNDNETKRLALMLGEMRSWAAASKFTPEEIKKAYPPAETSTRHATVKKITSVLIENGAIVSETPLAIRTKDKALTLR